MKEKTQQGLHKIEKTFLKQPKNVDSKEGVGSRTSQYEVLQDEAWTGDRSEDSESDRRYSEIQFSDEVSDSRHVSGAFFSYTVNDVTECFEKCGMEKFALDCCSKKLDGAFFRNFDLNELKFEPFSLKDSEVQKVKEIIEQKCRV